MADTKISALSAGVFSAAADIPAVQTAANVKLSFTAAGLALMDDAAASNQRTTLGLTALATTAPGTGVATALAINVGSAGAPVLFNGALGTPASGTLTNATGLPPAGVVGTAAILGANTFTAQQQVTQGTITTSQPHTLTQAWNAGAVTFTGLLVNITNTAAASASRLLDVQVGGSSQFWINRDGSVNLGAAVLYVNSAGQGASLWNGGSYAWSSTSNPTSGSPDLSLYRVAAGVMRLNGTGATSPAALQFYTYGASPPAAPAASEARLYADTSGAKIRIMALFPSGAAQQIAIEP